MLVVDYRGMAAAEAELLESSGFLGRLLHSWDDPKVDPVNLIIVATRLDEPVRNKLQAAAQAGGSNDIKPGDFFEETSNQVKERIRSQLENELRKIWADSEGAISEAKDEVIASILKSLQIHPVSAQEHKKFLSMQSWDPH